LSEVYSEADPWIDRDAVNDAKSVTLRQQPPGIERLRQQHSLPRKQQMTRSGIDGCGVRIEQPFRPVAIEASHVYPADLRRPSGVIDEVFPIRKDERRSMIVLSGLELCDDGGLTTGRRHSKQRTGWVRREQNRTVGLPCAAARNGGLREDLNGLAGDVETLQFLLSEEANRPTVRRPERKGGAFGAGQQSTRVEASGRSHRGCWPPTPGATTIC
jgi:hypothetical protein